METVNLIDGLMILNTKRQAFNLKQIRNRRFMYSSKYHTLILGDAKAGVKIIGSHAQEFHSCNAEGNFDDYIRGWIGRNSTDYRQGIIHFAPQLCVSTMDEGLSILRILSKFDGFGKNSKVRGIQNLSECSLIDLLPSLFI